MVDFLMISKRQTKNNTVEIFPTFVVKKSTDLMIRGNDFYAIWMEDKGLWSTDEQDAILIIDNELDKYAAEYKKTADQDQHIRVLHMWNSDNRVISKWHTYCKKDMRDNFHELDSKIIFADVETTKKDYASRKLSYSMGPGSIDAWDRMMSVLYSEEERRKIEWAIGAIISGDSKKIQKFLVFYGAAGTGKSTVLNVIQKLFDGYYSVFDAKALGSSNNSFALEAFKDNPLVAIQHDGDLSRIEDNTRLNSLVSHETMTVNEKFKSIYSNKFRCFLFMGTNKPVKITDARSGLIRRLIDVSPTGDKLPIKEYNRLVKQIDFELGAIAAHCLEVYKDDPGYFDDYIPMNMLSASNDFYNFMIFAYSDFKESNSTTLQEAWKLYNTYCEMANITISKFSQRIFKEELKNYFEDYKDRFISDGGRVRSYYIGFKTDKFEPEDRPEEEPSQNWVIFDKTESLLDKELKDCPAQYANSKGTPSKAWDDISTTLSEINTKRVHYLRPPENHIVIDFDIVDENGNKSMAKNMEAANKWPPTYAELSKSGEGIHLHYIYTGDVDSLSMVYADNIEIKVFKGKSSLRRKLSKCNDIPIKTISSNLPLKETKGDKMINEEVFQNESRLRAIIKKCLNKRIDELVSTKQNIDFIFKILEDAYNSGIQYDVSDMVTPITTFANNSTNNSLYCLKVVNRMHFKSESIDTKKDNNTNTLVFFDVEVFPNVNIVCWKVQGPDKPVAIMVNPKPRDIDELLSYNLVGYNCRRYDNHILCAIKMGYDPAAVYRLSTKLINNDSNAYFGSAWNYSYVDVYDMCSEKKSLKKWEIDLDIYHQELEYDWNKPVPDDKIDQVANYCCNDVIATEKVFDARQADFKARCMIAALSGGSVNDTTNSHSTKFIFGGNSHPQDQFNYRDLGSELNGTVQEFDDDIYTVFDIDGKPVFPGYIYDHGVSTYRGEEVGEGGYVYSEPGIYTDVALLDIASMHPSSIIAENLFGDEYTQRFRDIRDARVAIKHKDFKTARTMLNGAFAAYLVDEEQAKDLSSALKIVINSVYGLTAANFDNPFRDNRNVDNIVAKRGALFMINLKHKVQEMGYTVAHIKTDSIKIPNATPEIISFVMEYGKRYGYTFEHEATYERMCLVNDAVYIAKYADRDEWTATGTEFQIPYVFKTLFSKEPIEFKDHCETKSVTTALYLDMNEKLGEDEHNYIFIGKVGNFVPILKGCGGGELLRLNKDGGYSNAVGCKGYRWLESSYVKDHNLENIIDSSYHIKMVDDAMADISKFAEKRGCTAMQFISGEAI